MTTQITLPPATQVPLAGNPAGDIDLVITALMAMSATSTVTPSGVTSGAADSANISAAITAHGLAILGPGTYYMNATAGPLVTGQWIICMPGVFINWKGAGDCFRFADTSTYTARAIQGGGILGRPIIDGTSHATGASCGVHAGDILGLRLDVAVQNFSGAGDIGVHLDNQNYWTEQLQGALYVSNCTSLVVLDCGGASTSTGSYDRADLTVYLQQFANQNGVVLQNGAQILGGRLRMFGNVSSSSSAMSNAVLTLTGATPGGHSPATFSSLAQCELDINVESDEGLAFTATTITYGSTSNVITSCGGNVSFGGGNQFTQSNVTTVSAQFQFFGPVAGDPTLEEVSVPTRLAVSGSVSFFSEISVQNVVNVEGVTGGGATAGTRYAGATASGAPASGTFLLGDFIIDQTGKVWVCTTAGSPGTWTQVGPVTSVTAGDTSIVVGGTAAAPTIGTGTLDKIALDHPAAASWSNNFHGISSVASLGVTGVTGATAACRLVGAIASGSAPASGTFLTGDMIIIQTGGIAICTAGGTPGTWTTIT